MEASQSYQYSIRQDNIQVIIVDLSSDSMVFNPNTTMELRIQQSELIGSVEKREGKKYEFKATRDFYNFIANATYKSAEIPVDVSRARIVTAVFKMCESGEFNKISLDDVLAVISTLSG